MNRPHFWNKRLHLCHINCHPNYVSDQVRPERHACHTITVLVFVNAQSHIDFCLRPLSPGFCSPNCNEGWTTLPTLRMILVSIKSIENVGEWKPRLILIHQTNCLLLLWQSHWQTNWSRSSESCTCTCDKPFSGTGNKSMLNYIRASLTKFMESWQASKFTRNLRRLKTVPGQGWLNTRLWPGLPGPDLQIMRNSWMLLWNNSILVLLCS